MQMEQWLGRAKYANLHLATCNGELDLSNDDGRFLSRLMGAFTSKEVERKSERQKRAILQKAQKEAAPAGPRPMAMTMTTKL